MKRLRGKLKKQRDLLIRVAVGEETDDDRRLLKANFIGKQDLKEIFDIGDQTIYRATKNNN